MRVALAALRAQAARARPGADTPAAVAAAARRAAAPDTEEAIWAAAGEGEAAAEAPHALARRLAAGAEWEPWKAALRGVLLAWHADALATEAAAAGGAATAPPPRGNKYVLRLKLLHRSAEYAPVVVRAALAAEAPWLGAFVVGGPEAPGVPRAAGTMLGLALGGARAEDLAPSTVREAWEVAVPPPAGVAAFSLALDALDGAPAFGLDGSGADLRAAALGLSALVCGDFGAGATPWSPSDARVAFRRERARRGAPPAYRVRVLEEGGAAREAPLSERRLWAVVACFDLLAELRPEHGVPTPAPPPPQEAPAWRRAAGALRGLVGA
jgi:hypothetical protein